MLLLLLLLVLLVLLLLLCHTVWLVVLLQSLQAGCNVVGLPAVVVICSMDDRWAAATAGVLYGSVTAKAWCV
jgi:hypothetical protein